CASVRTKRLSLVTDAPPDTDRDAQPLFNVDLGDAQSSVCESSWRAGSVSFPVTWNTHESPRYREAHASRSPADAKLSQIDLAVIDLSFRSTATPVADDWPRERPTMYI